MRLLGQIVFKYSINHTTLDNNFRNIKIVLQIGMQLQLTLIAAEYDNCCRAQFV